MRERIGYVSQLGGADDLATGRENLMLQGRLYGGRPANVSARADELMDMLDLGEFADRKVKTYSGGQRRRLDIALGIVHQPEVLFLDEPTPASTRRTAPTSGTTSAPLRERGTTIFLTTHYLEEADALCDRLMIMDHGEIVADGTPARAEAAGGRRLGRAEPARRARDGRPGALTLLAAQPYVREARPATRNSSGCTSEDGGARAAASILRLLDARAGRAALDEPVGADARRRLPPPDRPLAARRRHGSDDEGRAA